ncbi:MAG: hypothetical protein CMP83_10535 [Gammaproteobacteria bacterium]|nr:hypothetical protein [Gammaproteobacteria bacterium]
MILIYIYYMSNKIKKSIKQARMKSNEWTLIEHRKHHNNNFNDGLATAIYELFKPKTILEFGCGVGYYCNYWSNCEGVQTVHGIEPNKRDDKMFKNKNCKQLTFNLINDDESQFEFLDKYDLVVSIEVAEHIDRKYHDKLFDFLTKKSKNIIIFSGARLDQPGHGHIACRSEEDWRSEFLKRNKNFDIKNTNNLRNKSNKKNVNHRKNVQVFKNNEIYELNEIKNTEYTNKLFDKQHIFFELYKVCNYKFTQGYGSYLFDGEKYKYCRLMYEKQELLYNSVKNINNVLEIGTYMGHSVFIMLLSNPTLKITCIDINSTYTKPCIQLLNKYFNNRITFIHGNSLLILPKLNTKFDFFHIDGAHNNSIISKEFNLIQKLNYDNVLLKVLFDDQIKMVELQKQIQKTFTIRKEIKPECCWNNIYYEIIINKSLIVSFCNYDYVKLAEIWVTELSKLNITNYIIISADQKTYEHLKSKNINTELSNHDKKESFWVYRMKVIQSFLEKNTNDYLVHSDLDAIWKKNICEELFNEYNNTDLFFSQGTVFPEEHLKKHNFVLCCGFFCIKNNDKTRKFIDKYINNLIVIKDDQKAINLELINTKWNTNNNDPKSLPNTKYVYYDNDINGYNPDYDIDILLISFNKIQRKFLNKEGYIYHLLTPKISSKKIDFFKKSNII